MKISWMMLCLSVFPALAAEAAPVPGPILVIGASHESAKTPCVIGKTSTLGCISVGFGKYLSLGQALTRSPLNDGIVLVEAIAGATTFDRPGYIGDTPAEVGWEEQGYVKQWQRALAAATNPITGQVNAKYGVIGIANDCLHDNAFTTPPSQSTQCSAADRDAVVSRYIAVGQQALAAGVTPVYTGYPPLAPAGTDKGVDLALVQATYGFSFVISNADYVDLASRFNTRIAAELPQAINAHVFRRFTHMGDGLHPDRRTALHAAKTLMIAIRRHER